MKIKYLVMDVDGTLTDGKIYMGNNGEVMKAFSIHDGFGVNKIAIPMGIIPVVITGRKSKIVENRCAELGITELYQGVENKSERLMSITRDFSQVAYIGDDLNDLSCMKMVKEAGGILGCPADAVESIRNICDFICTKRSGDGAVREFIEYICKKI